jgi:hypothetical protein
MQKARAQVLNMLRRKYERLNESFLKASKDETLHVTTRERALEKWLLVNRMLTMLEIVESNTRWT